VLTDGTAYNKASRPAMPPRAARAPAKAFLSAPPVKGTTVASGVMLPVAGMTGLAGTIGAAVGQIAVGTVTVTTAGEPLGPQWSQLVVMVLQGIVGAGEVVQPQCSYVMVSV